MTTPGGTQVGTSLSITTLCPQPAIPRVGESAACVQMTLSGPHSGTLHTGQGHVIVDGMLGSSHPGVYRPQLSGWALADHCAQLSWEGSFQTQLYSPLGSLVPAPSFCVLPRVVC